MLKLYVRRIMTHGVRELNPSFECARKLYLFEKDVL